MEDFLRLRQEVGGQEIVREPAGEAWLREVVPPFRELCLAEGVAVPDGFEAEVKEMAGALDNPGSFLAFAPGDTCPDNNRLGGEGQYLRFFDFEFSGFLHALLDATYFHLPFPTCWCVNRLQDVLVERMTNAYRRELIAGCPEAAHDELFSTLCFRHMPIGR